LKKQCYHKKQPMVTQLLFFLHQKDADYGEIRMCFNIRKEGDKGIDSSILYEKGSEYGAEQT